MIILDSTFIKIEIRLTSYSFLNQQFKTLFPNKDLSEAWFDQRAEKEFKFEDDHHKTDSGKGLYVLKVASNILSCWLYILPRGSA